MRIQTKIKIGKDEFEFSGHQEYLNAIVKALKIHTAKNHDYSTNEDPLANFKESLSFGVSPEMGIMVRLSDKWSRLKTFFRGEEYKVKDEKVEDTLLDLANYALLMYAVLKDGEKNE